ncbi:MAG TPA: phosphoenolpyruvate--protein phosphotransferase [Acidobacteriota bacterium]|nr:phosphoenolpyruvate--protein phosphotransferase [Acidobacteriota bacterium]
MSQIESKPKMLQGRPLSPGAALGTAYRVTPRVTGFFRLSIRLEEVEDEIERLQNALKDSLRQLYRVRDRLESKVGREHSFIIDAHLAILEDGRFLQEIESRVRKERQSPERAVRETAERWLDLYRGIDDPFFRERGSDLEEVAERILGNLRRSRSRGEEAEEAPQDLVLVAPRISLLVLTQFRLDRIKALVLTQCGRMSHVSIICRSCRIPVVTGIEHLHRFIRSGDTLAVDGTRGSVYLNPSPEESERFRDREAQHREQEPPGDPEPCRTLDGQHIRILVNTEVGREVEMGLRLGGEGIGLFRSESIYAERREGPVDEDTQFEIYADLARRARDRTAIVRTLDIGDEEHPYFSGLSGVPVPLLGLRGIRLSLRYPELFRSQVRAILRARAEGDLKIALPMVSSPAEVRQARSIIGQVESDLDPPPGEVGPVQVGIMVEVPAALIEIDSMLAEADFLLVGSNDLIQFLLAVSRTDERSSDLYDPYHPAVMASLNRVAQACRRSGKMGLVCGEVAADPQYAPLLVGMGFETLSMNPFAIPEIKERLRHFTGDHLRKLVSTLLDMSDAREIERRARSELQAPTQV